MIDLYIFDMGGVLCRGFDIGPAAALRLGLGLEEWRRLAMPDMQALMRGDLDAAGYWRRFQDRSGIEVSEDLWATLFSPWLDPPTVELVRALRTAQGVPVVCGTNTIEAHYAIHRDLGQYGLFDRVYASHLMGRAKPEAEFWLTILAAERVDPGRAFFVDDYPENVEAASELGIHALLYRDAPTLRRDLEALGAMPGTPEAVARADPGVVA